MSENRGRIAVIGAGAAGIAAAYLLDQHYEVTLFEKKQRLGGHTNTIEIESGPDKGVRVDTGFIVLNDRNYPTLHRFLQRLGIYVRNSDMSFSFSCDVSGFRYGSSSLKALFPEYRYIFDFGYLKFLNEVWRFWKAARADLNRGALKDVSVGQYLKRLQFSERFFNDYLAPFAAAIWSAPAESLRDFPAETLVRFFHNHGMLTYNEQPQWQTVIGGSSSYLEAFKKDFKGTILLNSRIIHVRRAENSIYISEEQAGQIEFDYVVIATHADEALKLLFDPSPIEKQVLGAWKYNRNHTVLHTDRSFLPADRTIWSSWNYRRERGEFGDRPISVTYYMNKLQGLAAENDYCVTLNPRKPPEGIIYEVTYCHPIYDLEALQSQNRLHEINGKRRTWFCGSYFGYGFHEDAIKSGVTVASAFKIEL